MRTELPDNGWADIISRKEIPERIYRVVERAEQKTTYVTTGWLQQGYEPPQLWPKELRDVDNWPEADREANRKEVERRNLVNLRITSGTTDEEDAIFDAYNDTLILSLVKEWSYGEVTADVLGSLSRDITGALAQKCRDEFKGTEVEVEPDPNPKAPTDA